MLASVSIRVDGPIDIEIYRSDINAIRENIQWTYPPWAGTPILSSILRA